MPVPVMVRMTGVAGTKITGQVWNIGRYGLTFRMGPGFDQTEEEADLILPDSRSAHVRIKILHRQGVDPNTMAYGGEIAFPEEDGRRKVHTFISGLSPGLMRCRRKAERRLLDATGIENKRLRERRRKADIFAESIAFAARAHAWDQISTVCRRSEGISAVRVIMDGRELVSFGSKDYLGLSHDGRVKEAVIQAVRKYGTHATGSRAVNGTNPIHEQLEAELAEFVGAKAAFVFPSGYLANFAVLSCLLRKGDAAVADEKVHASMIDGCVASGATLLRFRHNSAEDLERKLLKVDTPRTLILVEGVYSTHGDLGSLPEIKAIATANGTPIMLDDGHGFGLLGPTGAGTAEHFGLEGQIDIYLGLFSKALASPGGFIACEQHLSDYLRHMSRGIIFTTALPPAMAAGALTALRIIRTERYLRERLWLNVTTMKSGLEALGYHPVGGQSPIIAIRVGHEHVAYEMTKRLEKSGIHVNTFIRPAVKRGEALIRLTMSAAHSSDDIERALQAFDEMRGTPLFETVESLNGLL
ncbi:MAG: aminotransferase class I/II-fold pyridoxal phosphate-dependent enzyme [Nitrospirota bacterium]